MRILPLCLLLAVPLLAACDSNTPKAPADKAAATTTAKVTPPKATAATAKLPAGARPLIGSWAADASGCSDATSLTVVSAASYAVGAKSCEIALTDNKDGTFSTSCGSQKLSFTPIFGPTGEGIRIAAGEGKPATVFRCKK
ncbi:MAG: hypothetical protein JWQ89_2571 [Devosia sp.]|uniref:hypothetical protein n=1 Tax=Devosia sp. TaxID=1871048 RepID=UPI0026077226|nr:hypothetical protein [Devosia sp.]MDB5540844.1 hypothetical protein [Devosia sp.]